MHNIPEIKFESTWHGIPETKEEAILAVHDIAERGTPGEFSTGMAELLGISFDQFLRFAQLSHEGQLRVIRGLSLHFMFKDNTDKNGHYSQ